MVLRDIFKIAFTVAIWILGILCGIAVVATVAEGLIAFASTGIGAIILIFIAYKIWSGRNN